MDVPRSRLLSRRPQALYRAMAAAVVLCLIAQSASAMRCGNRLVQVGDSQLKVHELCGEPATTHTKTLYQEQSLQQVQTHARQDASPGIYATAQGVAAVEKVEIEEWVFNFGPNQLVRKVQFHEGSVISIEHGGYGF